MQETRRRILEAFEAAQTARREVAKETAQTLGMRNPTSDAIVTAFTKRINHLDDGDGAVRWSGVLPGAVVVHGGQVDTVADQIAVAYEGTKLRSSRAKTASGLPWIERSGTRFAAVARATSEPAELTVMRGSWAGTSVMQNRVRRRGLVGLDLSSEAWRQWLDLLPSARIPATSAARVRPLHPRP